MNKRFKILHFEDSIIDSELIQSMIESGGVHYEYLKATNINDFIRILNTENIDIILSNYVLSDSNGNEALKELKASHSNIPFIYVSEPMGEDVAINGMINGATDYVFKNKLERLVPAIFRALSESDIKEKRKESDVLLAESEELFKNIFNIAPIGIALIDTSTGKLYNINSTFAKIAGRSIQEIAKIDWLSLINPTDIQLVMKNMELLVSGAINKFQMESRIIHPDGSFVWINMTISQLIYFDKSQPHHLCMIEDVTGHKLAEEELIVVNRELVFQNEEKEKRASELTIANKEFIFQNEEKEKRAAELTIANEELVYQNVEKEKRAAELTIANEELVYQNDEKEKRAAELTIANEELVYQNDEKEKRAAELTIANIELDFQNEEKEKRAAELIIANKELFFQNEEKEKRAAELIIANKELFFQNEEKEKRAAELIIANKELFFQNEEKEKRAAELTIANKELVYQTEEKEKRAAELIIADKELFFQTEEKEKRAAELTIANIELVYQTEEKEKRAAELIIADKELFFQTEEKEKRAEELIIANIELDYQTEEKEKRAAELRIADKELVFQTEENEKRGAELRIANKELKYQNELKERTKQLIEANKELVLAKSEAEKANKAKSTFLANMSHEIRTPMNAVLGFSELLNNLVTDPKAKNFLKSIQSSGKTLLSLINDILDLSKIEAGMLVIQTHIIDIKQLIEEIKEVFYFKIEEKGLDFIIDFADNIPLQLYLDELRLRQVILNLVGNAVKFTDKGYVKISVKYLNDNGKQSTITIEVEDTGIGIPEESQQKVFNAFQQQDLQDTHKYGGTGLGLSISFRLTSLMNGKILLESKPDVGSKFTIILNDVKRGLEELIATDLPDENVDILEFAPAKILIVDDVENNRDLIKGYLDEYNFSLIEAENGLEAVSMAEKEKPDMILMDIRMPVMNGYEATRLIKQNNDLSHIPIIILTASYMESETDPDFKMLIGGYLIKPLKKSILIGEVKKYLKFTVTKREIHEIEQGDDHTDDIFKIDVKLLNILKSDYMLEWEGLKNRKPQVLLKSFSKKLIAFGKENKISIIEGYGTNLLESVNLFDITNINSKLRDFPKIIKRFV